MLVKQSSISKKSVVSIRDHLYYKDVIKQNLFNYWVLVIQPDKLSLPQVCTDHICKYFTHNTAVLAPQGCYSRYTIDWEAYKQQKFISHSSRGWAVQDRGTAWSGSGESPLLGCRLASSHYVLTRQEGNGVSLGPLL